MNTDRADALLAWFGPRQRDLPWRRTRDPWQICVAEVMLQQTQVSRVVAKWLVFLERFPDVYACAQAPLSEVLVLWQGLGYPRRARNLHLLARQVVEHHDGQIPSELGALLALPGIGNYTARALLAFAFEHDAAVVDTNAARVLARWHGRPMTAKQVQLAADDALPLGSSWAWNQAMLDLGATLCRPGTAHCGQCPVAHWCSWRGHSETADPAVGSAGVSKAQARFAGSDRELRGKVMRMVTQHGWARSELHRQLAIDDVERVDRIVDGLQAEGLVAQTEGVVHLPH
jgi:A/G-specific adenine glycosylase